MKPEKYKGAITREAFLFNESRLVAGLMLEDLSKEEIVKRIVDENLFRYPTEKMVPSIAKTLVHRLSLPQDREVLCLIHDGFHSTAKQASLYCFMLDNLLVYEFLVDVIGSKYASLDLSFSKGDIHLYLDRIAMVDEKASKWSKLTKDKIRSVLVQTLVSVGYLDDPRATRLNPFQIDFQLLECIENDGNEDVLPAFNYRR